MSEDTIYVEDIRLPDTIEEINQILQIKQEIGEAIDEMAIKEMNPFFNPSEEQIKELVSGKLQEHAVNWSSDEFRAIIQRIEVILQTQEQLREFKVTNDELKLVTDNYDQFFKPEEESE